MIYDKSGNELKSAYNKKGDALNLGFDKDANIIYNIDTYEETEDTPVVPKYSINNVISYLRSRTETVAAQINALPSDWKTFVLITDIHNGYLQMQHSQAIAMYILDNTPCDKIITLGDYCNMEWIKSQYQQYMSAFTKAGFTDYVFPVFGNHETIGGKTVEARTTIFNDFLKRKANIFGVPKSMYYYTENTETRMRYVFINTSDANSYRVGADQIEWIKTAVTVPDSTWHVAVFGHVNLDSIGGVTYSNLQNPADVISAINTSNGNIIGYFCGHQHIDNTRKMTNSFQQTILLNDRNENTNYYPGYSVTNREKGRASEQAVSVVSVNTSTKKVTVRRIGAGRSNQFEYSY